MSKNWSVMDNVDQGAGEQSLYQSDESFEHEINVANGSVVEEASGAEIAKDRRQQDQNVFYESDFGPVPEEGLVNALDSYDGAKHADEVKTPEDFQSYAYYREALFAERHPDYHAVVNRYLLADLEDIPPDKLRAAMLDDDFPAHAYAEAKRRQKQAMSGAPSMEEIDQMDGETFAKRLNEWTRSARSSQDEEDEGAFVSRLEKRRLSRLSLPEFEKQLDWVKANRGS